MSGDPVYRIADLSTVWLEGEVFEQDLPAVRLGQQVTAEFGAPGRGRQGGSPTSTRPSIPRRARPTSGWRWQSGPRLKPGMYATFRFDRPPPVLTVPRSAVLATGERTWCSCATDGTLAPHDVILGVATDDRAEVLRGSRPARRWSPPRRSWSTPNRIWTRRSAAWRTCPAWTCRRSGHPRRRRGRHHAEANHRLVGPQPAGGAVFTAAAVAAGSWR